MRILVTGGAGFIGSAYVRHVLASDASAEVLTYDLLTYAGHLVSLEGLPDPTRHHFVQGDVADPEAVASAIESFRPTHVVNFAAESHVDQSLVDPARFVRTNVMGAQVLLDACRRVGIRLLHVSTDEVYGSLPEPEAALPDSALRPTSPYAASKAAADLLALAAARSLEQEVVLTRCTNNYGPRQLPEKLVPLMILRAAAGQDLPVYGDGLQERDWIHVNDHAAGVHEALMQGRAGRIYHFAGRTTVPNLDIVAAILRHTGGDGPQVRHVGDRPGHDRRYALDDEATRRELGWSPRVAFEEGLADTVEWYRSNHSWVRQTASPELSTFLDRNYGDR